MGVKSLKKDNGDGGWTLFAFLTECCGIRSIVFCHMSCQAKYDTYIAARDNGWDLKHGDITVKRAPEYDERRTVGGTVPRPRTCYSPDYFVDPCETERELDEARTKTSANLILVDEIEKKTTKLSGERDQDVRDLVRIIVEKGPDYKATEYGDMTSHLLGCLDRILGLIGRGER